MKISFFDIFRSIGSPRLKAIKLIDHVAGGLIALLLPSATSQDFPGQIKNVLIVRPGGIGDAVFLLPILKALKEKGFIVDVLAERRNEEVFLSQSGFVNRVYCYDREPLAVFSNNYDLVIDTEQWHFFSGILSCFVKGAYRIGYVTRQRRGKLYHHSVGYTYDGYELDNFGKLFDRILKVDEIAGLEGSFDVDAPSQLWAKKQIEGGFVTLFLGGSIALRRLNEEQIRGVVKNYVDKGFSIALLGGRDVEAFAGKLSARIDSRKVINFVGQLSLMQSAALIQQSTLFVGPDSGLMHLACAVDVPVVAIFGPGNRAKWGPRGSKHRVISLDLPCSPCTDFGYTIPTCKGSYQCMKDIKLKGFDQ